ncbi:hypothetical protein ANABIO32_06600 [Rossellomorea marisflavi]|uniref:XRE family transcriptional regulator n=1 Tax=Rossellomorea marisflavi TaxID=189381 RepID=UPI0025C88E70|nr:XRE family transcriptional regulator [Rossellomorea marisflavi]GLI82972.1 hypothetical protein ANABIO32_06600 [Rossellomorea marisflavi]
MNVQLLFDTGEITRKLERVRKEYKRNIEPEVEIQTGFGHTLSRMSLTRFEKAVNRHSKDQEEDFRQYMNTLMYEKDVTQATILRRSLIKVSTLIWNINGSREIPTIIVFRIALSLKLNLLETETLLRKVRKRFMKTHMDGVIMEAIKHRIYDVIKVEAVLHKYTNGEKSLFTEKEQEELGLREEDLEI